MLGIILVVGLDVISLEFFLCEYFLYILKNCVIIFYIGSVMVYVCNVMVELVVKNLIVGLKGKRLLLLVL